MVIGFANVPLVALLKVSVMFAPPDPEALRERGARIDSAADPVVPDQTPAVVEAGPPVSSTTAVPLIVLIAYQVVPSEDTRLFKVRQLALEAALAQIMSSRVTVTVPGSLMQKSRMLKMLAPKLAPLLIVTKFH